MSRPRRVAVVSADAALQEFLASLLADEGYVVSQASLPDAAPELLQRWSPELLVLDAGRSRVQLAAVLARVRQSAGWPGPILLLTTLPVSAIEQQALGVTVLDMPFGLDELLQTVRQLLG